jgi:4'-phosphopantetheinyl transferase
MTCDGWKAPPIDLALPHGEVHVWRGSLEETSVSVARLESVLCEQEMLRADRWRFERDRRRFVVARGTLRTLLGRYLGVDPASVRFGYGRYGKPVLLDQPGQGRLCFNVAHSEDLALYLFARDQEVGVDLERVRPIRQMEQVARCCFSEFERAALQRVHPSERTEAFYACWTRKEAYAKARGDGLALRLDSFDVSLAPGEPARLLGVRPSPDGGSRMPGPWSLRSLDPGSGYVGALAVEGPIGVLERWQVPNAPRMRQSRVWTQDDKIGRRPVSGPVTPVESTR